MPLASSKHGFTTLDILIAIGIFVLLVGIAGAYLGEWRPSQLHTEAVEVVRDTLLRARTNADNGRNGENWSVTFQSTALTLQGLTSGEQESFSLPQQTVLSWQGGSTTTFTAPYGFPTAAKNFTITTGSLSTSFVLNDYGILEKQ